MERIEQERLVADAILLERAAKVLERRQLAYSFSLEERVEFLRRAGEKLRQDAEVEVTAPPFPVVPSGQIEAEVAEDVHRMGWTK